uniref:Phospholipase A2 inhibitor 31 kDa subunit n=1 Tax=Naja kaouthia TaxID=8649 RepID=PLIGB_NAJKA|nr:RecName: Full=Phospholipase A2 inhibitor 31 kDa subunit; AltName: Full=gamma-PLI [Naja kaouthia]AAB32582.1 phospholipase A2 31 kda subunit, PLA2 31 kda subunit=urokinase-type plasminogen activator receptor homolog [Naja naja kaouthia=Thailand cobras, blood, Peptide, 188 aa] [Naja kaouthia]
HSCEICHNVGKSCEGSVEPCTSPEDQCGTVVLEFSPAPVSFRSIHKNCFSSSLCKLGSFDVNVGQNTYVRGRIQCCDEERCEEPQFSGHCASHPNGYYCPGIFGLFSLDSSANEAVCKGTETKCINIAGYRKEMYPGDIAYNIKGCISSCPELSLSNRTHEVDRNELIKVECTDAVKIPPSECQSSGI